ncbi:rRNA N6-adenosine-methyltransferase ZCCHC4 [Euwallacea fornicatus]|uniref:rRNA N6-adenosine-methyltransferase ZCCHC4 n=1 Tax=Euwallacea fornicatus TaxID=995702 RepID=UPI00338F2C37
MKTFPKFKQPDNHHGIKVITESLNTHPCCPHGPTLLFSTLINNQEKRFFGCAACRDRKLCSFFMWDDKPRKVLDSQKVWQEKGVKFSKGICHRRLFIRLNQIKCLPSSKRIFCSSCLKFTIDEEAKHIGHSFLSNITDYQLQHPSELLPPLDDAKMEAQYLFSKDSVKFLVDTFKNLGFRHIICVGTPRIHEYIQSSETNLSSILLDFDHRFHNFFGPLEYCWYNMFNNHFFFHEAQSVFKEYLKATKGEQTVLVTDPPFGGRTEPLIQTFNSINRQYKNLTNTENNLPIFWIFPYFMEPQIVNLRPDFKMLDYKVQYDNHALFHNGSKGRKQGSPVRIFTNLNPSKIKLPEEDYKFCSKCSRWVAKENKHCKTCGGCTSKNGETYVHCKKCERCVKPNWRHCYDCGRCAQVNHQCGKIEFTGVCLHCKAEGHKQKECPEIVKSEKVSRKRKHTQKILRNKKIKMDG